MRGAATGGCLCTFMSRSSGWRFLRGADSTHARRSVVSGDVLVPGLYCLVSYVFMLCPTGTTPAGKILIVLLKLNNAQIVQKNQKMVAEDANEKELFTRDDTSHREVA